MNDVRRGDASRFEVCANSVASGLAAQTGGADRIELCRDLQVGGLTPDEETIDKALDVLDMPVHVLVRPRAGDFEYDGADITAMLETISRCRRRFDVAGVVIGCLRRKNPRVSGHAAIDLDTLDRLLDGCGPMHATFHRAFDALRPEEQEEAMECLIDRGVGRILTSGGSPNVSEGADQLAHLVRQAAGRIVIMPGGGLAEDNIAEIRRRTGAAEFHGSLHGAASETDPERVRKVMEILAAGD